MKKISFYKPNPRNTGAAASFSVRNSINNEEDFYMNIVRQVSWDSDKRLGSFKSDDPSNKIAIKFNMVELGSIIRSILYKEEFSTVHMFDKVATSISFKQSEYTKSYKGKDTTVKVLNINVSKNKEKYSVSLDFSEATVLWVFCQHAIILMSKAEVYEKEKNTNSF